MIMYYLAQYLLLVLLNFYLLGLKSQEKVLISVTTGKSHTEMALSFLFVFQLTVNAYDLFFDKLHQGGLRCILY